MSRLKIIILVFVIASSVAGYIYYRNASLSTISLDTKSSSFSLYNSVDKKPFATISSPTELRLHNGQYCAIALDKKYSNTPSCFSVYRTDLSFTFDVGYSSDYLKELLPVEQDIINSVIRSTYPNSIGNYTICKGSLYGKGDIYGSVIVEKVVDRSDSTDSYRVVLKKEDGSWKVTRNPVIVLDKTTFKDISFDTLQKINTSEVCDPEVLPKTSTPSTPVFFNNPATLPTA